MLKIWGIHLNILKMRLICKVQYFMYYISQLFVVAVIRRAFSARLACYVFLLDLLRLNPILYKGLVYVFGAHRSDSDFLADQFHLFELETDLF